MFTVKAWRRAHIARRCPCAGRSARYSTPSARMAGSAERQLKKLNGAAFTTPFASTVVTSAIGRGTTAADQQLVAFAPRSASAKSKETALLSAKRGRRRSRRGQSFARGRKRRARSPMSGWCCAAPCTARVMTALEMLGHQRSRRAARCRRFSASMILPMLGDRALRGVRPAMDREDERAARAHLVARSAASSALPVISASSDVELAGEADRLRPVAAVHRVLFAQDMRLEAQRVCCGRQLAGEHWRRPCRSRPSRTSKTSRASASAGRGDPMRRLIGLELDQAFDRRGAPSASRTSVRLTPRLARRSNPPAASCPASAPAR